MRSPAPRRPASPAGAPQIRSSRPPRSRLCRGVVTTAGSGTGNVLVYDNATTNSGTVIGVVPATVAVGTMYTFEMPVATGITVANVASGPVLTLSYA